MVNKKIEITDLKDMLNKTKKAYGSRPAYKLRTKTPGEYQEITHKEVRDMVDCLGTALVSLLNLKGKRVAVIGENRYEWEVAYLSVVAGTGIVVPLDKALPENELDSLIRRSEVDAIFYSEKYEPILKKLEKAGKLEAVMALVEAHKNDTMEQKAKIFKDIHDIFGENIKLLVSGAAALDSKVEEGYRNFGINLVQGYGLTESSPVVCVNYFPGKDENKHRCGTIGKALPKVQVKIEEPNEEGIGELMVKGPNVMMGYFGDEEATKETIEDGWLHTGDLCSIDKDGYIYIYGRKKSVIVLKNGKNIFPEEMENLVNKIEGVQESMIYSILNKDAKDENDIRIAARVVYDKDIMKEMYNIEDEKEIYEIINNKIKEINKIMPLYKSIRGLTITQEPFIKTTTGKIKRQENLKFLNK